MILGKHDGKQIPLTFDFLFHIYLNAIISDLYEHPTHMKSIWFDFYTYIYLCMRMKETTY